MEPRVSVLVTFYNQKKYVNQALQSVINQKTKFGIKILVGDDGSSDGTQEIVKQWIEKYPDIIDLHIMDRISGNHISGFRASMNRLELLKYVNTDYFIFLDGDDFFDYDLKLQTQVDILDDSKNLDCIACGHNIDKQFGDIKRVSLTANWLKEGKYSPKYYWGNAYIHTDTLLIRSSAIRNIDQKLLEHNFNDNMITFSVIQNGNLYYIPKAWAVYSQTGDGIWTSGKRVINHIRNLFLYDLCNQINPNMKKQTARRFYRDWMFLYIYRNKIDLEDLEAYSVEAKNKNMVNSYNWIHYRELSILSKQTMCIKAIIKGFNGLFREICLEIYHDTFKKRKVNDKKSISCRG